MYLINITLNSLAAVLRINKSNAAGNSKRLYTLGLQAKLLNKLICRFC